MLNVNYIPLYQNESEDWNRFLYKAAKGSVKATDVLSYAEMAYMAALTGDPKAPETLQLSDYHSTLRDYFATFDRPDSAQHLAEAIDCNNWFAIKLRGQLAAPKEAGTYSALWSRGRTVSEHTLLNDSICQCHSSWSADWLIQVIDGETSLDFNSLNVVAAMLLLAVTWKVK